MLALSDLHNFDNFFAGERDNQPRRRGRGRVECAAAAAAAGPRAVVGWSTFFQKLAQTLARTLAQTLRSLESVGLSSKARKSNTDDALLHRALAPSGGARQHSKREREGERERSSELSLISHSQRGCSRPADSVVPPASLGSDEGAQQSVPASPISNDGFRAATAIEPWKARASKDASRAVAISTI